MSLRCLDLMSDSSVITRRTMGEIFFRQHITKGILRKSELCHTKIPFMT